MGYELEFIGVDEETKDATAICMRWKSEKGTYIIGVVDGGLKIHGEKLKNHMDEYYFKGIKNKNVDFVICSHPHQDHCSGLVEILQNYTVKQIYMNTPWKHIDSLFEQVNDRRITKKSLCERLKEKYCYIANLEEIAIKEEIPIEDIFEGDIIESKLLVLSPSKEFYLQLLAESNKTLLNKSETFMVEDTLPAKKDAELIEESWESETLKEDVATEPDNETSTVILGEMEEESFLLTGDVGKRGLDKAIIYAENIEKPIKDKVKVYEIPHHGGRHNLSTSILNRLIGETVKKDKNIGKVAFVCSGKKSDHPHQMVINAFKRRGVNVYNASGNTIRHRKDMEGRNGWSKAKSLEFNINVEKWDENSS